MIEMRQFSKLHPIVAIQSTVAPNPFLRMDGTGITEPSGVGGGAVNCQNSVGPFEKFRLVPQEGESYALESVEFKNVFLRIDGADVTEFEAAGAGAVNCQFGAGAFERFKLSPEGQDSVAIGSVQFPNVFLRMDGHSAVVFNPAGSGIVNCQFGAGPFEKFRLVPVALVPDV